MNIRPLVTIGIPFYNAEPYIIATLESVRAQTYDNIELVLINDCSPDKSQPVVGGWLNANGGCFSDVILLNNKVNKGVAYSCRELQNNANGKYFTKLDADDIIFPNKISVQVSFLEKNPDVGMVYSNTTRIDANGVELPEDYFTHQKFSSV